MTNTSSSTPMPAARRKAKILIVDDALDLAVLMQELLEMHGHDVVHFPNGRSALHWIKSNVTDLAILDLDLPDMTGWDICQHLRRHPRWQQQPILICSGNTDPCAHHLKAWSVHGFIPKPFSLDTFVNQVHAALE